MRRDEGSAGIARVAEQTFNGPSYAVGEYTDDLRVMSPQMPVSAVDHNTLE